MFSAADTGGGDTGGGDNGGGGGGVVKDAVEKGKSNVLCFID